MASSASSSAAVALEESRKLLLDLTLRNRLINFRPTKRGHMAIVDESSREVFRMLVREGQAMQFAGVREEEVLPEDVDDGWDDDDILIEPETRIIQPEVDVLDDTLNTRIREDRLHGRLLHMYSLANTAMEEQGVNTLYLALGMLHWYESDASDERRHAPLILVPATLERYRGTRFRVRFSGEELGANLSLQAKLRNDFDLSLPDLPDDEDVDVDSYLESVAKAVGGQERWRVEVDEIQLGFFSYAKYLMYKDLDPSQWEDELTGEQADVVSQLLGDGFDQDGFDEIPEGLLDTHRPVETVHEVLDADSSQAMVLMDVLSGRSMVVEGPPGTGKSQTITNIVAEAVAHGKTVLFVAEKMAALNVVRRKLDSVELGSLCLELHSHKAKKREVLADLSETADLGRPRLDQCKQTLQELELRRARINDYVMALHAPIGESGVTPYVAIGHLVKLHENLEVYPKVDFNELKDLDAAAFSQLRSDAMGVQAKIRAIGPPHDHAYFGCSTTGMLPSDVHELRQAVVPAREATAAVVARSRALAEALGISPPATTDGASAQAKIAAHLAESPTGEEELGLLVEEWRDREDWIRERLETGRRAANLRSGYGSALEDAAWSRSVSGELAAARRFGTKWWRFLAPSYMSIGRVIVELCGGKPPRSVSDRVELLEAIDEHQTLTTSLTGDEAKLKEMFGGLWKGVESDWSALEHLATWAEELWALASRLQQCRDVVGHAQGGVDAELLGALAEDSTSALAELAIRWKPLEDTLKPDQAGVVDDGSEGSLRLDKLSERIAGWCDDPEGAIEVSEYNRLIEPLRRNGFTTMCDVADTWEDAGESLLAALDNAWHDGLYRQALDERPALRSFERSSHEQVAEEFRELDARVLELNRARVAQEHWERLPRGTSAGALGTLRHEFGKKRRHMPIRRLMENCWRPIQCIKPVFLMSPLSVAKYIPPDGPKFDLVIFDEASQVRPADAFGALLRGRQGVVVGDSKQMPPTSFFQQLAETSADSEVSIPVGDMESVLTLFRARGAHVRSLLWHYRSQHDSLIAVSNKAFYRERLQVFPSPRPTGEEEGLEFVHLPDTVYGRGHSSTNPEEARHVANRILEHARTRPELTIGAVAFSQRQQESILGQLEKLRLENPELIALDAAHPHEPVFVKNLENVQGDERDVILISVGYGTDDRGVLSHNFGPLTIDGGERRLNVLISRARKQCTVFANFTAEDIDLRRSGARGVEVLKTYLGYARDGIFEDELGVDREPDSPFEEAVRDALIGRGYDVRCQVGSAGYFIDLAVVDPEHPGSYLLGIECDGATYHSALSARDRDRLRQQVLESRGWRIHRIWSPDWFARPGKCLDALGADIEKQKRIANSEPRPEQERQSKGVSSNGISRDPQYTSLADVGEAEEFPAYEDTVVIPLPSGTQFHMINDWSVQLSAGLVLEREGPVHIDEVVRALREAVGLRRSGSRVQEKVARALDELCRSEKAVRAGDFYDVPREDPVPVRSRSEFPPQRKKLEYVCDAELDRAIVIVTTESYGIGVDELAQNVLRRMGFLRATSPMKDRVEGRVGKLVATGALKKENGLLVIGA